MFVLAEHKKLVKQSSFFYFFQRNYFFELLNFASYYKLALENLFHGLTRLLIFIKTALPEKCIKKYSDTLAQNSDERDLCSVHK